MDAGGSGGFPGSDAAVLLPYAYRRRLHVEASNGQLPTGLTVSFELDHAALVAAGKCAADGHDLRVLRRESGKLVEVTRVLALGASWASATTRIEFSLLADVTTPTDDSYYVYYGDNEAGMADEDRSHVYLVWDDFEDGTLDPHWKLSQIGGAVGLLNQDAGKLHIEALGDDIGGTSDELVLVSREVSGDFVADCRVAASGGALGADAKVGGVMVRQSLDAGSQQRIAAPMNGAAAFTNAYRVAPGGDTAQDTVPGPNPIPAFARVTRLGQSSRAWRSADGESWEEIGTAMTFTGLSDPVRVGVPLANRDTKSLGWVDVDWFRVRRWVEPAPSVTLDAEEPGPFSR